MTLQSHAVKAVWRRQLWSLLGNPLGYVFVLAFVLIYGGLLFLPADFFVRNINDLGPIHDTMPWLLAVLVPSITMGSWASERELGTEEQLLTLPISETEVMLGKWLAASTYLTLALVCSLSNVAVLMWLGSPDLGLILAQYFGWWLVGLVFSAVGIMASTWVSLPAVAFVIGAVLCGGVCAIEDAAQWLDAFERGVVSVGQITVAISVAAFFLGIAVLSLSSRRWQSAQKGVAAGTIVVFVCGMITVFNLSVQLDRAAIDVDVTEEGLSSLSEMSVSLLNGQENVVEITAFVSKNLPPELVLKGQEVLNLLKLVQRSAPDNVKLKIFRPEDSLDEWGSLASEHFGLTPEIVTVDTVTGQEQREIFLGAVVTSGSRTEKITHFSPGLSVEYELVRAVRTAATAKRPVLGIARTELDILGGFSYQARQMQPSWQAILELKKQYNVRPVNLDVPVGDDVSVLIVPQPSSLTETAVKNLHDFIWAGRPTLILEDPMPMFAGPKLGSSQPRAPKGPQMLGQQRPEQAPKPDLTPLFTALGVNIKLDKVVWSDFNPSHQFRNLWPRHLVWSMRTKDGIRDTDFLKGVDSLLFPWPGEIRLIESPPKELAITPLSLPAKGSNWGRHAYDDFMENTLFGKRMKQPQKYVPSSSERPSVAVEIKGYMKRVYGQSTSSLEVAPNAENGPAVGTLGDTPVHVILIADTDFAHDEFFAFYRNSNNRLSDDAVKFLLELKNVQFISNAIDTLAGEKGYLKLRTRRPRPRPLTTLVEVLDDALLAFRKAETGAQEAAQAKLDKLQGEFEKRLDEIQGREGLDENAKNQLRAQIQRSAQRRLDAETIAIQREKDLAVRAASVKRQREVEEVRGQVRTMALGLPSIVLACIAVVVWLRRRRDEMLTVPASRQRGQS